MNKEKEYGNKYINSKLRVLFVSSGNSESGISPIVLNQGNSLKKDRVVVDYFTIQGKGLSGYIKLKLIYKRQVVFQDTGYHAGIEIMKK